MLINIDFSASNKDSVHSPFQYEVHPSRFLMRFQTTLSIGLDPGPNPLIQILTAHTSTLNLVL